MILEVFFLYLFRYWHTVSFSVHPYENGAAKKPPAAVQMKSKWANRRGAEIQVNERGTQSSIASDFHSHCIIELSQRLDILPMIPHISFPLSHQAFHSRAIKMPLKCNLRRVALIWDRHRVSRDVSLHNA